jgi:xanthine dehydrogenase large subunit
MQDSGSVVRFVLDGETVTLADVDPTATLLDHLRYRMGRTGTKEGCAEGDCGACTVLVGELAGPSVRWRAVNACILFLPMLDGRALLTVESLSRTGTPHPLQMRMAGNGSSQCGFCTPGFVMSLYGRSIGASGSDLPVADVIAGNLCRCTGYGPILASAAACARETVDDTATAEGLQALRMPAGRRGRYGDRRWFAPKTIAELAAILAEHSDARMVAGATDVGLWVTKGLRMLDTLVFLGDVAGLGVLHEEPEGLRIGAAVRYADAHAALGRLHPDLGALVGRIGGLQVRNSGTIGGNIANGSPIGDGPPALIALGAELRLCSASGWRTMPLEAYFLGRGRQDLRPGEFIESISVPRPAAGDIVHISKLSRRFDSDIAAVCGAFRLTVADGRIIAARVAFGGMAATPRRAPACEAALVGAPFALDTIERAAAALRTDYAPIDDLRGSAGYRMDAAANLLRRLWHRTQGDAVSVRGLESGRDPPASSAASAPPASPPHDSALLHVTGAACYVDDVPAPPGLLHLAFGQSSAAHARILGIDLSAVRAAEGVVAVLTAADIAGVNDVSPVAGDDPLMAEHEVYCVGQALFIVAATSHAAARKAARLAVVRYEPLPAHVTIAEAEAAGADIEPPQRMARGDAARALALAPHRLAGALAIGGQDHFYMEGQVALAMPQEEGRLHILASTQHPSEIQHLVAKLLGLAHADVTVEVRRMGGAFGGKETQAALYAAAAALVASTTGRPAKIRADRDDDMVMTGKRHDFTVRYDVGFDDDGRMLGLRLELASRCGATVDLSPAINDRAMFHVDNCYWLPDVEILSRRLRTNTVSNTAFRGFGAPQGMVAIERVIDAIAAHLGRDPLAVRQANLYGPGRDTTPYGMTVADNIAPELIARLRADAHYDARRAAVRAFNADSPVLKKGIALTPVKFGVSFTTTHLNQAGALVLVYADGSIQVNHGGTEMGQGVMVKVAQIVADVFAVPLSVVRVTATRTDKVPNTSATAASCGSDLNGMAAHAAAMTVRDRLADFAAQTFGCATAAVRFAAEGVTAGSARLSFAELCRKAHVGRVSLASTGYYATPDIGYDRPSHRGRPFYYFAYGAAVAEVVIDTLTGEHRVLAVDILHDVGRSLNPAIDLGQIEGGFVQGQGWLTTEQLVFDTGGRLLTHSPATYKIPTASDRPARLQIALWDGANVEPTIHRSKAVGEPPFMLAISVFSALAQAVMAVAPDAGALPPLAAPATPEQILAAIRAHRDGQ